MASTGSNSGSPAAEAAPGVDGAARADIVIALTSRNDVQTIGSVAIALRDGLARYCPSQAVRFILADAGSTDGTREAAREAVGPAAIEEVAHQRGPRLGELPYHGDQGRALALRAVLQAAQRLGAGSCTIVDASLRSVQPEWVERLVTPVLSGEVDYVSPFYTRPLNEGAMTRGIVYPMFRALYGARLRQPAATEFSCSARLVTHFLEQELWEVEQAAAGIDLWLAVAAVCGEFRVCEAELGARAAMPRTTAADLSTTLSQVAAALFADLDRRLDVWQRARGSVAIPIVGSVPALPAEPALPPIEALLESFRFGYRELREIWARVLPPRTIVELRKLTDSPSSRFRLDDRLWAGIVYDFALAYSFRTLPREHVLRSMAPLYSGWLASFALQLEAASQADIEARVERLCQGFEAEKPHLISRWRWPERRS